MKYKEERMEYNYSLREFMLGEYVYDLKGLYAYYERLKDKRKARGIRYSLADALSLITLAKLGGEDGPRGISEWLKHRAQQLIAALKLPRASMPHPVTISRILGKAVEVEEL